ncbi:MAG: nucleoside triphosphate pyrophosphohydrolase, partial [Gammaproteobacteria bacterium]|nr:nucleoside triphosphate pyrophosphohydrolase [Gammaproteobacteria bacterium]
MTALEELLEVMRRLRDPQTGCAWDREQTLSSIVPHTLEEAHEVADAIASGSMTAIRDELGDLLFQVVFLARIAEEQGEFAFDDVARAIVDKLVRRHPHVFQHHQSLTSSEQTAAWESMKAAERRADGADGVLAGVARSLPALTRAAKLGKRAARVGFDWPEVDGVRAKVDEELAEFEATLRDGE